MSVIYKEAAQDVYVPIQAVTTSKVMLLYVQKAYVL